MRSDMRWRGFEARPKVGGFWPVIIAVALLGAASIYTLSLAAIEIQRVSRALPFAGMGPLWPAVAAMVAAGVLCVAGVLTVVAYAAPLPPWLHSALPFIGRSQWLMDQLVRIDSAGEEERANRFFAITIGSVAPEDRTFRAALDAGTSVGDAVALGYGSAAWGHVVLNGLPELQAEAISPHYSCRKGVVTRVARAAEFVWASESFGSGRGAPRAMRGTAVMVPAIVGILVISASVLLSGLATWQADTLVDMNNATFCHLIPYAPQCQRKGAPT